MLCTPCTCEVLPSSYRYKTVEVSSMSCTMYEVRKYEERKPKKRVVPKGKWLRERNERGELMGWIK